MSDKPKKPRGQPSIFIRVFGDQLGPSIHKPSRWPEKVLAGLDDEAKVLLGWMALKPENRARAVKLIPAKLRAKLLRQVEQPAIMQDTPDSTDTSF